MIGGCSVKVVNNIQHDQPCAQSPISGPAVQAQHVTEPHILPIGWWYYPSAGGTTHRLVVLPIGWWYYPGTTHRQKVPGHSYSSLNFKCYIHNPKLGIPTWPRSGLPSPRSSVTLAPQLQIVSCSYRPCLADTSAFSQLQVQQRFQSPGQVRGFGQKSRFFKIPFSRKCINFKF
jgi:hypothetical protein